MTEIEHALNQLPQTLREEAAGHWRQFAAAAETAGVALPAGETLEPLVRVWACSEFIARTCVRDPHLLADLLAGDLTVAYPADGHSKRLADALEEIENEEQLNVALRRFRRREMVRIGWRDLAGLASLEETLADLSNLADAVLEAALERLYRWQTERFGIPRDTRGQARQLVVLGMGKLGGRELNFSSDIDLMFTFPHRGETDGRRSLANEEFFRRLGQRLIKSLNEITPEGFVFRVDMRLRPFGDSGPLVMPFTAFEEYYQNHGREWERYAMIKARVVAGEREAGEQLMNRLRPFVYRRYLDYGAIEALRTMKGLIAKEVERKGLQRNIKLGPGGIREIEFIGQVFQLIYGGREPALRERGIIAVLDSLANSRHLPAGAVLNLKKAYEFLRRVENRLQAWSDRQTHNLPEDAAGRLRLAYAMGYAGWDAFHEDLRAHIQAVSEQFDQIFAETETAPAAGFTALQREGITDEEAVRLLEEQGFDDPGRAWKHLQGLKRGYHYRSMGPRGSERLDTLLPLVLDAVIQAGVAPTETLEQVLQVLETILRRSAYLALLIENPLALSQLVKLCGASPWISKQLARYPLLLDELLDPETLYHPVLRSQLAADLEDHLERVAADDPEQCLEALRHFKHINVLRVAAADVSDAMPLMVVSDYLTEIAEVLLRKVLEFSQADLLARHGRPFCVEGGQQREAGFVIIAYGKLGGIELNYGSDLDLVFLHDSRGEQQQTDGKRELDNSTFFTRLVQRIIYWLTTQTAAGELYQVDTRLRPSGRAGLLVSSIEAFAEYQRNDAWTWEHQALARARVVAGSAELAERFGEVRREILSRERDPDGLRGEVREMRERMRQELGSARPGLFDLKQDRGGIADIEFMVQYAVLANAHRYPDLLTYTDNIRQLDGLERFGILSTGDASLLRDAYRGLRRRMHLLTLQEKPALIPEGELKDYREEVVRLWQALMAVN